ncbi:hypothetical protein HII31_03720 [Pseudocercospora fuligena]|uniref:Uncharacterized protein n=1 Tax=Pseudocercospora fuligena TaxID=685502 RepID=A0A8H6RMG0_9PEZI|nr:hypothetical protein HII31_03720 [Pseudocercospora fuligena]
MAPHWLFLPPRQLPRPIDEIFLFIFNEGKVFLLATFDEPPRWRVPSISIDETIQQVPIYEIVLRRMMDAVHKRAFEGIPFQHYFADQQDIDKAVTITSNQQRVLNIKLFLTNRSFNTKERVRDDKDNKWKDKWLDASASRPNSKWTALGEESRFEPPLSAQHFARMFDQQNTLQQIPTIQLLVNKMKICIKVKEIEDGELVIKRVLIAVKSEALQTSLLLMDVPEESWMAPGFQKHNIIKQSYGKPQSPEFETVEYKIIGRYCPIWGHPEPTFHVTEAILRDLIDKGGHRRVGWEPWTARTELATGED